MLGDTPQFSAGLNAWANSELRTSNPYNRLSQPVYWGRWDNGWLEGDRIGDDDYHYEDTSDFE